MHRRTTSGTAATTPIVHSESTNAYQQVNEVQYASIVPVKPEQSNNNPVNPVPRDVVYSELKANHNGSVWFRQQRLS